MRTKSKPKTRTFTVVVEYDPEVKVYVGTVPGLHGAHTQGETLEELEANLKDVIELCIEEFGEPEADAPRLVGLHQIEVAV